MWETYYLHKKMSEYVDSKINQLDRGDTLGIKSEDIVGIGFTYQF
ncbi:porin [Salmonella enterica]